MKLAIFGSSPIALEAALRFNAFEAALTWFNGESEDLSGLFEVTGFGWDDCTTELGWSHLPGAKKGEFSWDKWKGIYYRPLVEFLSQHQVVKRARPISVTKRYLAPLEEIPARSRFYDLFRVIYELDPEQFINEQREADPETYARLSEEFVSSLQSGIEMYEDFDLVMDLSFATEALSMATSGRALGEKRIKDHVISGLKALGRVARLDGLDPDYRELALIGSGDLAVMTLLELDNWLRVPKNRLFIVSSEEMPFEGFMRLARLEVRERLQSLLKRMEDDFHREGQEFHERLREWQELEDYIKAKKQRPVEPIPRLVFFSGHNVTAIDQLIDKRRLFLTLEKPDWREGLKQPENNHVDLKTIGVDEVFVTTGLKTPKLVEGLGPQEPGYFEYAPKRPVFNDGWKEDLNALNEIEKKIFALFTPADTCQL
jgi:hypothetical protein